MTGRIGLLSGQRKAHSWARQSSTNSTRKTNQPTIASGSPGRTCSARATEPRSPGSSSTSRWAPLACTNVSAHDAAYVVLAEALNCPLLTRDIRLARSSGHLVRIEVR